MMTKHMNNHTHFMLKMAFHALREALGGECKLINLAALCANEHDGSIWLDRDRSNRSVHGHRASRLQIERIATLKRVCPHANSAIFVTRHKAASVRVQCSDRLDRQSAVEDDPNDLWGQPRNKHIKT